MYRHPKCPKLVLLGTKKEGNPERIIQEVGATELSKTPEGRKVLIKAGEKYKAELTQPGDPEFKKLYGKQIKEQAEMKRENERISEKMWKDRGIDPRKIQTRDSRF